MGILAGIAKRPSLGTGGILTAYIVKLDDISDYTQLGGTATITLSTPNTWLQYFFASETSSGDAPITGVPGQGTSYSTHTVNLTFAKKDAVLRNEVQALAQDELVIVLKDGDGYMEVYGGQDGEGLYLTAATAPTGAAKGDLNGYVLTLTANQAELPLTMETEPSTGGI
jgi:hypothetical protein